MNEFINDFLDSEGQIEADAWQIIGLSVACLDDPMAVQTDLWKLLTPPIYEKLATGFLQRQKADKTYRFLSSNQMFAIASKVEEAEIDIDQAPGVYIFFCSFGGERVLKVGKSNDLRRRIAWEHLRNGDMNNYSDLINYAKCYWTLNWPDCLNVNDVRALIFPMSGSRDVDRSLIELSLIEMLNPDML